MSETLATYGTRHAGDPLPCPFCGAYPIIETCCHDDPHPRRRVACETCEVGPSVSAQTRDLAVAAWTRRAQVGLGVPAEPHTGLVTTIRWTRVADGRPPWGMAVAVWIESLGVVVRAYRDATRDGWRVSGVEGPTIPVWMATAWADLPNGALPPPDDGGAS